ncbi:hypothetical protein C0J45_17261 [Silurus meridionalis]|nr:hypothetical protein C0J45_17261 [Silurus meridionalis]
MCLKPISVVISYRHRCSHPQNRCHIANNLIYPPLLSQSQTSVVGGLWNCQSAVRKADFITGLASHYTFDFLALTETWISPQNTATPAALSSAYAFSHSPRETGRGGVSVTSPINLFIIVIYRPPGPLGDFLEEMDTLLSTFPSDSTPLTVLGDFNLPADKLQSSCLLPFLNTFSLTFNSCPPTHKGGNVLDLVFTRPTPATDMTATPLPISDHHLVSFLIILPIQPKNNLHVSLIRPNLHSFSPSTVTSCTLSSLPDPDSFSSLPLDVATDSFLSSLSSTMDLLCPLTTRPKKSSCPTPWLSEVLRSSRRELRSAEKDEILQVIRSCNPTTCPLDPIPSTTLQTIMQDLLPFISTIINGSLTSGYVPTAFKQARVISILKKPALDPSDINNYRPVSLLSFLSKSLECTVFNQLSVCTEVVE